MKEILNQNYNIKFYDHNIIEIIFDPYKQNNKIDFYSIIKIDKSIRLEIKKYIYDEQFILILNFENIDYIDSAGIGAIRNAKFDLSRHNKKDTLILIKNLNYRILKIFRMLGLDDLIVKFI